jgi:transcriptional regulator with XRE-family HTH domain
MDMTTNYLAELLNRRRLDLRMSAEDLSRRSGVSTATVHRILAGEQAVSLANVNAVAGALGVSIRLEAPPAEQFREQEAERKARRLIGMVQGTMALESQGVGQEVIDREVQRTKFALLSGSPRKLWGM